MDEIRAIINKRHNSDKSKDHKSKVTFSQSTETSSRIKVRVILPSADIVVYQIDPKKRLSEFKMQLMHEMCEEPDPQPSTLRQLFQQYRLIKAEFDGEELNENHSLAKLHIEDEDTLVMIARRKDLYNYLREITLATGPTNEEIYAATSGVVSNYKNLPMIDTSEIFVDQDIHLDIRKVVISVAKMAAAVIAVGPFAKSVIETLKEKLINKRNKKKTSLESLMEAGYTKERAQYALNINRDNFAHAFHWLIYHQDTVFDESKLNYECDSALNLSPSSIETDNSMIENMIALKEIIRIYSHRAVPATIDDVEQLKEMGFGEKEIQEALHKTSNNLTSAAEWLCGQRNASLVELREGLDKDSPLVKEILEMPKVQMELHKPKVFIALINMIENQRAVRDWRDNDVTTLIVEMMRKYQEEKHNMGINQFYRNR